MLEGKLRDKWFSRGIAAFAMLLGMWADKDSVPGMSAILPFLDWLLPKVIIGAIVLLVVEFIVNLFFWVIDLKQEGPEIRAFQSLRPRMQECAESLSSYYGSPPKGLQRPVLFGKANVQTAALLEDLRRLNIAIPRFPHANDYDAVHYVLSYLASVEILAEQGRLKEARRLVVDAEWEYKEVNSG